MTTTVQRVRHHGPVPRWERPVRLTALHREHLALGADMVERAGWLLPDSYGEREQERATLRTAVGLLDIGELGKLDLMGQEIDDVLRAVVPQREDGAVGTVTTVQGGGGRVYRLTRDHALLLSPPDLEEDLLHRIQRAAAECSCVHITTVTGALAGLRLLGPRAPSVLERVSTLDLAPDRWPDASVVQGAVESIHAVVARRDAGGLPGYDLSVDRDLAVYLWQTLLEIGAPLGLRPVGRAAEEGLI